MAPLGGSSKESHELLGVDRYKPKHLGQVIGNTDQVRKLAEWLRDWDEVVLQGKTKAVEEKKEWQRWQAAPENINARAALISGPPGIGKTTTSVLVARCNRKYKVMEFNASDARSKKHVENLSSSLAGNHTLKLSKAGSAAGGNAIERSLIIMDECDGMAGGDVGGMQALMNMIKGTKSPIICICNDRGDQGVRKLAEVCYDIKFKRPDKSAVAKRIKNIMESEGKKVDLNALEATAEACGHDIRQVINQVQFFGTMAASGGSQKDSQVMLSPFDACQKLFSRGPDPGKPPEFALDRKFDLFYIDADLMPLMVQENYLRAFEHTKPDEEESAMKATAYAAELIAISDSMQGDWGLTSSAAAIGTLYPGYLASSPGNNHAWRAAFPAWMQKRQGYKKATLAVKEVHSKMRAVTTCSQRNLAITSFHDMLYRRLLHPLVIGDVKNCAAQLASVGLSREFFTDQAPVLRAPLGLEDGYKKVEGAKRAQLLQELQQLSAKPSAPTKRKRQDNGGNRGSQDIGEGNDDGEEPAGQGGEEGDMAKRKKAKAKAKSGGGKAGKDTGKASLSSWTKKPVVAVENTEGKMEVEEGDSNRKAALILKFIEGHTNAVRRKVSLQELLAPWREF